MSNEDKEKSIVAKWLFHFNCHTNTWDGFPIKEYKEYFAGTCKNVISNVEIQEIFSKIIEEADV
jgi:hypothetical protein